MAEELRYLKEIINARGKIEHVSQKIVSLDIYRVWNVLFV
jgi:hypothetical protein